jgi:uncharacterized membrane protein
MIKYLIQVIQTALPAAILAALLCGFTSGGDQKRKKFLSTGIIAGIVCALVLAVLRRVFPRLVGREYINIVILCAALFEEIVFLVCLAWARRKASARREKLFNLSSALILFALFFYALPAVFLYPSGFALPGESVFTTDFLFKLAGYLGGLLAVFLIAAALFRTASRLNARLSPDGRGVFPRVIVFLGLGIMMINQCASVVQVLLARRLIPMIRGLFSLIILIINYNDFFLYALMALTFLIPVILYAASLKPHRRGANPAEHRKILAALRGNRRWSAFLAAGYLMAILCLTALKTWEEREVVLSPAEPMNMAGGEILIPIENIEDGHLHRYNYTAGDGAEMRFIVIRKSSAAYGVGLDACDICGPTGYYERKDQVICKLCDVVMNISTIGFKGGCNPVPLAYSLRGGGMIIKTSDLEKESHRFKQ